MRKHRRIELVLGCGAVACALLLGLWPLDTFSSDAAADRAAWREKYRRPAEIPFPEGNAYSEAKSKLGRMLFFDPALSRSEARACAACHNPGLSWADGRPRAIGEKQAVLPLRTPTLLNVAWGGQLGWDGHFRNLEAVAFGPITSPTNMNMPEALLIGRLSGIPGYVEAFRAAFGDGPITRQKIEFALATFERSIVSGEAPFDRWINGDEQAISDRAKRGFDLFNGKANCAACHEGWAFTDASFHDIGVARDNDLGRGKLFPNSVKLQHAFKTPTLRDVVRRAPYMHDGSVATLEAVIDLYDRGGINRPSRADEIKPLGLSKDEKADLIAFLQTLSGKQMPVLVPRLPR
ncbi:MAG TPA: cytochrome c peroxidase [Pseudolabrys sp.]|nr:cytochrome c peroxidase [Pseudolabrys sp.]